MLDIKKVYIDTRFKTAESKSDSDFFIELPRSLNVPDNTICYITDIVIPVSWCTVDARNNKLYMRCQLAGGTLYKVVEVPAQNYTGPEFAAALGAALTTAFSPNFLVSFQVLYDANDAMITISQLSGSGGAIVFLVSNADLISGKHWSSPLAKESLHSINNIMRIGVDSYLLRENSPYVAMPDLHTIRNIYLTSSSLASYNIVSNFGNDVIIKKIAVKSSYGQMLFDSGEPGYDFLDVSKRSLSRIDFRMLDSFGNVLDLRGNHWSFSLVFQTK